MYVSYIYRYALALNNTGMSARPQNYCFTWETLRHHELLISQIMFTPERLGPHTLKVSVRDKKRLNMSDLLRATQSRAYMSAMLCKSETADAALLSRRVVPCRSSCRLTSQSERRSWTRIHTEPQVYDQLYFSTEKQTSLSNQAMNLKTNNHKNAHVFLEAERCRPSEDLKHFLQRIELKVNERQTI